MREIEVTAGIDMSALITKQIKKVQKRIHTDLRKAAIDAMKYVKSSIRMLAPIGTDNYGNQPKLATLIDSIPVLKRGNQGFDITANKYGYFEIVLDLSSRKYQKIIWVNNGTGIYGPSGYYIYPKKSEFLVFKIGDRWFKLRSVRGQKGKHFIEKGINVSKAIVKSKLRSAFK